MYITICHVVEGEGGTRERGEEGGGGEKEKDRVEGKREE